MRAYDAILLDLDGTLVDDQGTIHPRTRARLADARDDGVTVMVATGRSDGATIPVLEDLGLGTPAVVYNGAAVYCPWERRMLETQILAEAVVAAARDWSRAAGHLVVVAGTEGRYASEPRTASEERALQFYRGLRVVPSEELPTQNVIRLTVFSERHADSDELYGEILRRIERPTYVTHFPLRALANHRESQLHVADIQPPCRGKAEGLRVLAQRYGILPERVVAVGDAYNDVPMFEAAGLGVAMENAMPAARAAADRVIGDNNSDTLAALIEELFLD